jgi:hypothetical protein
MIAWWWLIPCAIVSLISGAALFLALCATLDAVNRALEDRDWRC